jgi:hypothetical protein
MTGDKKKLAERLAGFQTGLQLQRCGRTLPPGVTHVSNNVTDGPYGWTQEFDCSFSDTEINVTVRPKLVLDSGVTREQAEQVKTRARTEFQRVWDNKFIFTDTADNKPYNLRCDVTFVDSQEDYAIQLHAGSARADRQNWYVGGQDIDYAHELGHTLGLKDEYIDSTVPNRANGTSPGVFSDHSVMGDYYSEGIPAAEVKQRHGETIAGEIGGATHRNFTVTRRP